MVNKKEEIQKLLELGVTYNEISEKIKCSKRDISKIKKELDYIVNDTSSDFESKILKEIKKLNLSEYEVKNFLKQISTPEKKIKTFDHFYDSKSVKIGIISDTHIGSKFFNEELFMNAVKTFNREKVEAIYHCGDIIEGMSNREGHIYELKTLGTTAQLKEAAGTLSQLKQPLYFITGNHDEWASKKSNQGLIVGTTLEDMLPNANFLGEYNANVKIAPNVNMRLTHEGNTAYALSYSGQKRINSLSGGDKPEIIANGHLHKALQMFYRNIQYVEASTFQEQTPFMKMKGTPAMPGYYVFYISFNKRGINKFTPSFYPGY